MKAWWKSKTLWFNVVSLLVGVAGAVAPVAKTEWVIIAFTAFIAVGNGVLRFLTDTSIRPQS